MKTATREVDKRFTVDHFRGLLVQIKYVMFMKLYMIVGTLCKKIALTEKLLIITIEFWRKVVKLGSGIESSHMTLWPPPWCTRTK